MTRTLLGAFTFLGIFAFLFQSCSVRAEDPDLERARELIALVANTQQGHLESPDLEILAAYYEATGDLIAAEDAAAEARLLEDAGANESAPVGPAAGTGRVL